MAGPTIDAENGRQALDRLLGELRPKLHRYCARMTGSAVDGEDVVQEALANALQAYPGQGTILDPKSWLFRIAHNAALDFLRHRARLRAAHSNQDPDVVVDPTSGRDEREAAAASLRTFMHLPTAWRGSVILTDVLGYSLEETGKIMETSIPAVKAALHRGRARLRELARQPDDVALPSLTEPERSLLARYVERFNARDFDAIREMLAEEVRLELVNRARLNGRSEVARYFHNYGRIQDWHLVPGLVDRQPALLVRDPDQPSRRPSYFVLLGWTGEKIVTIRDFRFARYAAEDAELIMLG